MAAPTGRAAVSVSGATEGSAAAPDGTLLHTRHWQTVDKPWAVVLVVHGIAEHSGRYERPGRLMAEAGLDVYSYDLQTAQLTNLTGSLTTWDEHAQLSAGGGRIVWMSSQQSPSPLLTDYWLMDASGSNKERITFFNDAGSSDYIAGGVTSGDSSWNADGTKLAAYLIVSQQSRSGRIVMLNLTRAVSEVERAVGQAWTAVGVR